MAQLSLAAHPQPQALLHVRTVRRKLDFATLWKWLKLKEARPDYFTAYEPIAARIRATNAEVSKKFQVRELGESLADSFVLKIKAGKKEPALPDRFDGIDRKRVKQLVPTGRRETAA